MNVTRIVADSEGCSHFEDFVVSLREAGPIGRISDHLAGDGIIFRETDETYDYDWHPAPRKQWLILIDGSILIETGDGEKRSFRAGDILLLEDTEGRGHKSRQTSKGIRRSIFVPIPEGNH